MNTSSSDGEANSPSSTPALNLNKFAQPVPPSPAGIPGDGGEGQTLFIRRVASEVADQAGAGASAVAEPDEAPVEAMLGLVTYCYVRGVFSSKEIAERLRQDAELRRQFGRWLPNEEAVKAFRRRHAGEIEEVLENVYRAFPPGQNPAADGAAAPASQTEVVRREAAERLHDATWEDNMRSHLH